MIKEYKSIVKAEQFDGSDEMISKYHIFKDESDWPSYNVRYFLNEVGGPGKYAEIGYWIVTEPNGDKYSVEDDVFKKNYQEVNADE